MRERKGIQPFALYGFPLSGSKFHNSLQQNARRSKAGGSMQYLVCTVLCLQRWLLVWVSPEVQWIWAVLWTGCWSQPSVFPQPLLFFSMGRRPNVLWPQKFPFSVFIWSFSCLVWPGLPGNPGCCVLPWKKQFCCLADGGLCVTPSMERYLQDPQELGEHASKAWMWPKAVMLM